MYITPRSHGHRYRCKWSSYRSDTQASCCLPLLSASSHSAGHCADTNTAFNETRLNVHWLSMEASNPASAQHNGLQLLFKSRGAPDPDVVLPQRPARGEEQYGHAEIRWPQPQSAISHPATVGHDTFDRALNCVTVLTSRRRLNGCLPVVIPGIYPQLNTPIWWAELEIHLREDPNCDTGIGSKCIGMTWMWIWQFCLLH